MHKKDFANHMTKLQKVKIIWETEKCPFVKKNLAETNILVLKFEPNIVFSNRQQKFFFFLGQALENFEQASNAKGKYMQWGFCLGGLLGVWTCRVVLLSPRYCEKSISP